MAIQMLGDPEPVEIRIRLDSARGNPIENGQITEISAFERNQFGLYKRWEQNVDLRGDPTPRYNCHGMTFASRRTSVCGRSAINQILMEDDYVEVKPSEVLAGDVIVYFSPDGDAEHSGVVVAPPDTGTLGVPRVVSKWGKYAEFVHWAHNCPYNFSNARYFRIQCK